MPMRTASSCRTALLAVLALACSSSTDSAMPVHDAGAKHDAETIDAETIDAGPARDVRFDKITLHRDFYCEGANTGDLDRDGVTDVIAGPHWYAGPDFTQQHALWQVMQPFDVRGYSDCFFQWTRDLNGDGALDIVVVGFPGQPGFWLENPGVSAQARDGEWMRHEIIDMVDNESPEYLDLIGDDEPELLLAHGGKLAYVAWDGGTWTVHAISDDRGFAPFTHGLGAADINGDGRKDVLEATAWWEQPASLDGDPVWIRHEQLFGSGGAQMHGYDIDGDGDTDVAATLSAHGFGLAWYEQLEDGTFLDHIIVSGATPAPDAEVILHEPHALAVADVDGDGLLDLITGERHWGHVPEGEAFETPAHLYWFGLVRDASGARFEPHLIDDDSGVGTQLTIADVDGNDRPDIVIANKNGAFVFVQR